MKNLLSFIISLILPIISFSQTETKLLDSEGEARDNFGRSVAISGNHAIVGAPNHTGNIDMHELNDYGKVVIYERNGDVWSEQDVEAPDYDLAHEELMFGYSVDIDGDFAIIGAPWGDEDGEKSGLAYIYHLEEGNWNCYAKLKGFGSSEDDRFGISVAISGNHAIVGAFFDDVYGERSGSAHIFEYNGTSWNQVAKLFPADGAEGDWFGVSVCIHNNYAAVGSRYNTNAGGTDAGAVYLYKKNSDGWGLLEKLTAPPGSDQPRFEKCALTDGHVIIGAPYSDDYATNGGKVYLAENDGGDLSLFIGQYSDEISDNDLYGNSIALSDSLIVIGAPGHADTGKVYLFDLSNPGPAIGLHTEQGDVDDNYGFDVDVDGNYIIVGAMYDDEKADYAGAAYIYKMAGDEPTGINPLKAEVANSLYAYPNPFLNNTTISYNLPENAHVKINVYDITGTLVSTICESNQTAGIKTIEWNARGNNNEVIPAGTYICNVQSSIFNTFIKIIKTNY